MRRIVTRRADQILTSARFGARSKERSWRNCSRSSSPAETLESECSDTGFGTTDLGISNRGFHRHSGAESKLKCGVRKHSVTATPTSRVHLAATATYRLHAVRSLIESAADPQLCVRSRWHGRRWREGSCECRRPKTCSSTCVTPGSTGNRNSRRVVEQRDGLGRKT